MRRIPAISILLFAVVSVALAGGFGHFEPVRPRGYGPGVNLAIGVPVCGLIGVLIDAVVFWMAAGFKRNKVLSGALLSQGALIMAWGIGYGLSGKESSPTILASAPFVVFGIQLLANYFIVGDYLRFKAERLYITLAVCMALGNIPFLLLALADSIGRYGINC